MSATRDWPVSNLLDVRRAEDFEHQHRSGAVNIPLEELSRRTHELPPRNAPLMVFDSDSRRARWAASRLRARERAVEQVVSGNDWLAAGPTESGVSRRRLWRPHALLAQALPMITTESPARAITALDLACGAGRDAVFLSYAGFRVDACDVLPDALELCRDLARRYGGAVRAFPADLERSPAIPAHEYDLITCFNFLHRPLMPIIAEVLRPGGWLIYETFVAPQREMFGKPSRPSRVLDPGELARFFAGWEVRVYREGLTGPRRYAASLVARKPA